MIEALATAAIVELASALAAAGEALTGCAGILFVLVLHARGEL